MTLHFFGGYTLMQSDRASVDILLGTRYLDLDGGWHRPWWVDVGTAQSNLAWQLAGGVGYAFCNIEVSLLYRHLEWNFGAGDPLDNIRFSGPMLATTRRL